MTSTHSLNDISNKINETNMIKRHAKEDLPNTLNLLFDAVRHSLHLDDQQTALYITKKHTGDTKYLLRSDDERKSLITKDYCNFFLNIDVNNQTLTCPIKLNVSIDPHFYDLEIEDADSIQIKTGIKNLDDRRDKIEQFSKRINNRFWELAGI